MPRDLNLDDNARAAAANNQGREGGNCTGAPQGPAAAANNQGHGGGGRAGAPQGPAGVLLTIKDVEEEIALELLKALLVLLTIKDVEEEITLELLKALQALLVLLLL